MLTVQRIARLVEGQRWTGLLEELFRNGRPLPLAARARLTEDAGASLAALGLGLQRAVELAYAPDDSLLMLADRLATVLNAGAVGEAAASRPPNPAALAMAARGLADLLDAARDRGWAMGRGLSGERLRAALREAAYGLFAAQAHTGAVRPREHGLIGDGLDSALVLWQLMGRTGVMERLDPPVNLRALAAAADRAGLWRDADCAAILDLAVPRPERAVRAA
jgi:hypothetical protein